MLYIMMEEKLLFLALPNGYVRWNANGGKALYFLILISLFKYVRLWSTDWCHLIYYGFSLMWLYFSYFIFLCFPWLCLAFVISYYFSESNASVYQHCTFSNHSHPSIVVYLPFPCNYCTASKFFRVCQSCPPSPTTFSSTRPRPQRTHRPLKLHFYLPPASWMFKGSVYRGVSQPELSPTAHGSLIIANTKSFILFNSSWWYSTGPCLL